MPTIKSCTDIEQSRKLAEFLPYESADMRIGNYVGKSGKVDGTNVHYYQKDESFGAPEIIPCWSLAALMDLLPSSVTEDGINYMLKISKDGIGRNVVCYKSDTTSIHICEESYDLIDVIFELICWLVKEEKLYLL
jgi:hypothetical protein